MNFSGRGGPHVTLNAVPVPRLHTLDFLAAIDKRSHPVADLEDGHISSASCILANMAAELERPLVYDLTQWKATSDAEATRLLRKAYRNPGPIRPIDWAEEPSKGEVQLVHRPKRASFGPRSGRHL